jgi:Cdc6-like AAA superfamily ATPase
MKRVGKEFGSVGSEKKIMEALRILETYKTTLFMYSTSPARPTPSKANIQSFRDIPAKQVSYFVGREEIFRQLARHLEDTTVTTSDRRTVVLIGMGGQSKTQIALEYCRRAQASSTFKFIFWVNASSENYMTRSYGSIAEKLTGSRVPFLDDKSRVSCQRIFWIVAR